MDIKQIQFEVFQQTGVNIDANDPFLAAMIMLYKMGYIIENKNKKLVEDLIHAASAYDRRRTYWHGLNERLITDQVNQVKHAVQEISNIKNYIGEVSAAQAKSQLQPVLSEISVVLKQLQNKDSLAAEQLQITTNIQERWSQIIPYIFLGVLFISILSFAGGFFLGNSKPDQETPKISQKY